MQGVEGAVIIDKIKAAEKGIGYDALNDKYVDMKKSGIVIRLKLQDQHFKFSINSFSNSTYNWNISSG